MHDYQKMIFLSKFTITSAHQEQTDSESTAINKQISCLSSLKLSMSENGVACTISYIYLLITLFTWRSQAACLLNFGIDFNKDFYSLM